jgi:putative ABC transport system permease protein
MKVEPPPIFARFFRWFAQPGLRDHIEGDLIEEYYERVRTCGKRAADWRFIIDVVLLFRPGIIRGFNLQENLNICRMHKSYWTIAWRNVRKNKGYALINVTGLAIGITVALFIGLWIYDEVSFNRYHKNYDTIAQVYACETNTTTGEIECAQNTQVPLGNTLRDNYPEYFEKVLASWWIGEFALSTPGKKFKRNGLFIEGGALEMLSLRMLKGSYESLQHPNSIVLSESTAKALFGRDDPINKTITLHGRMQARVTGVYEDIPLNSRFGELQFFAPFALWMSVNEWLHGREGDWDNRPFGYFIQLKPDVDIANVNAAIKGLYKSHVPSDFYTTVARFKPYPLLVPMSKWHLFSEFENGQPASGRITYVRIFAAVGIFVLLLACINFINLTTARSEKRSREVGVRKAIGAAKGQLVSQFMTESFVVIIISFSVSLLLLIFLRPIFNEVADKRINLPFNEINFWLSSFAFVLITTLLAGTYPAFFLSSFDALRVLKGKFTAARLSSLPRRIMVVVQFTVSVALAIGTLVVYQQIQHAQNRPVGYDRAGLLYMTLDQNYKGKVDKLRNELMRTNVLAATSTSFSPVTEIWNTTSGYDWAGKDPSLDANFAICNVSMDFGETVNWHILDGRDFSKQHATDSMDAIIINEAAARYMGMQEPVGKLLIDLDETGKKKWTRTIIGVVKDILMESPYSTVRPTLYFYNSNALNVLNMRIKPSVSVSHALSKIEDVVREVVPEAVFSYNFADDAYSKKFSQEKRIGKLSAIFAVLGMIICCLGLFGLASYVAEQRTKEIGIRKVIGASVFQLWKMLSLNFIQLVVISCAIAVPAAYFVMNGWLQRFEYRTTISIWLLVGACVSAGVVSLVTVSLQTARAARRNPVKSLRSE